MVKPNPEYLRQYELCRKMAGQTKLSDLKLAWLELAGKWLALAKLPRHALEPATIAVRPSSPTLHLKKFAGSSR